MVKIIILCGESLTVFQRDVLNCILIEPQISVSAVLIDIRPKPSLKKRFIKNLKRGRGGYMLIMFFASLRKNKEPVVATSAFFSSMGIPCIETTNPYTQQTVDSISPYNADMMVLIGGFGIVKEPLLSANTGGILSFHHGDMRKYRGQPAGFWELYYGESEMGVTVQRIGAGIDNGIPIKEIKVPIMKKDNHISLCTRAKEMSVGMMRDAILAVQAENYRLNTLEKFGPVFTIPNLRQYLLMRWRLITRRLMKDNSIK